MEKRISQFHGGTFIQYQGQLHFIVINTMCELLLSIILSTWLNYIAFVHKCVVGRPFLPKGPAAKKCVASSDTYVVPKCSRITRIRVTHQVCRRVSSYFMDVAIRSRISLILTVSE